MDTYSRCFYYVVCNTLRLYLTILAANVDNLATAATAAVAKLDPQNGFAPSSHVVLVT